MKAAKNPVSRPRGRPRGSLNKRTQEVYEAAKKTGEMPVEFLLRQMRNSRNKLEVRMSAASAAAPYLHARIQAVEHSGNLGISHEDALAELEDGGD